MAHTKDRHPPAATVSFTLNEQLDIAAESHPCHLGKRQPTVGLVLGSGLGAYAIASRTRRHRLRRHPRFPLSTVSGTPAGSGRLAGGVTCAAMQGRVHFYEARTCATWSSRCARSSAWASRPSHHQRRVA